MQMILLTLMNRSDAEMDSTSDWFDRLYLLEALLIFWSYFECGLYFLVLLKSTHYHPNLIWMLEHLVGQYFFSMAFRLVQIWFQYGNRDDESLMSSNIFVVCSICRSSLVFIAFSFSIFVMIERLCATYYKMDYEKNPRRYIGYILTILLYTWAASNMLCYVFEFVPVVYHIIFLFSMNSLAFFLCLMNEYYNNKRFMIDNFASESMVMYSLSERYQVLENVKTAQLFKIGIGFSSFFSVLCIVFLVGNRISISASNWLHIGFNYMAILYGIGFPAGMFLYDQKWRKIGKSYLKKITCCSNRTNPLSMDSSMSTATLPPPLRPDFIAESNIYFENLKNDWDTKIVHNRKV